MINTVERVTELAASRHMTMTALAKASGVPSTTLRSARSRNSQLTLDVIERLCRAMDVSLSEFFDEKTS
ncbi:MAG: helix-turn-helix transcriptional regulator [Oscillospiraceae bacterium]|nr:helix-turn-helix transcriptional regulator [Oscillospiraceae bacterium]